jgi:adenylate cyclase
MEAERDGGRPSGHERLRGLLSERNQYPERMAQIDEEICRTFEKKVAVLVLDMCGFSRLTRKHGIITYLAMIRQMEECARPAVEGNGGLVVKLEADNLFAIFAGPERALEAALDIHRAFEAVNSVVPDDRDIRGSIGIGFGDVLVIDDVDLFGDEMNVASKLGEDIATGSEILLSAAAFDALPPGRYRCSPLCCPISGMHVEYHRFEGLVYPKPGQPT